MTIAFQLLSSFSKKQLKQLALLLDQPFFNSKKEYVLLLELWQRNRGKAIDRQAIYAQLFPNKNYLERDWHLLTSRFLDKVEQFLIWEHLQTDQLEQKKILLQCLRKLQKHKLYEMNTKRIKKLSAKKQYYQASQLRYNYELEMGYYDFISSHNREQITNLQTVSNTLDHHFIAEKLKHACLAQSRKIANQEVYKIHYLEAILTDIDQRAALLEVPAIAIYKACYDAIVLQGDEAAFKHLRKTIEAYGAGFPTAEMRDIYLLAINYCVKAMNKSKLGFEEEAFALYVKSLEQGYLLKDGFMPGSTFSNMVALGIKRKAFEWTAQFIESQHGSIKQEERHSLVQFNTAQLAYAQKDLKTAASALVQVNTHSTFLYLGAKSLLLKVLYEAQEWDALDSTLASLRVYLQRRNDLGYHKEHYKLLLHFFKQLIQLKPNDKAARQALRQAISQADAFRMKEWFFKWV